jgi:hypothetical protein
MRLMTAYRYSGSNPADPRFHATAVIEDEELVTDKAFALLKHRGSFGDSQSGRSRWSNT